MLTEAKKKSNKKWNEKNREKSRYYSAKSVTKRFILETGSMEDLKLFRDLLDNRLKELKN